MYITAVYIYNLDIFFAVGRFFVFAVGKRKHATRCRQYQYLACSQFARKHEPKQQSKVQSMEFHQQTSAP